MRITFFSNFMNHHQLPLCQAMDRLTNGNFTFVSTTPVPKERIQMGYHDMNKQYPFILTTYDSEKNEILAQKLAIDSDILIIGSAPDKYIKMRLKKKKMTFRYAERLYKTGTSLVRLPHDLASAWLHFGRFQQPAFQMLCASAYTAADCARFGNFLGRTYKWGYFPEVKQQNIEDLLARKRSNKKVSILWAGRLIDWKHPDASIRVAKKLKQNGYEFKMNIIGNGVMEAQLKQMISDKKLDDYVHMLGAMSPEAVRDHMEAADIFLFTSDFNEGWGAVLNEAMNSACAVVASHAIGSVPFLMEDCVNGLIYRNGDENGLYERVKRLITEPDLREKMGKGAYQTLAEQWNAETAAERFIALAQALLEGKKPDLFETGPCSRAKRLKNWWYK